MALISEKISKNFIGHVNIVKVLINSLKMSNYTGAWILKGPKGIGKAYLAKEILANIFNIGNKNNRLLHPDLMILKKSEDNKKFIPVEEVRKVSLFLSKTSIAGKNKSILIDSITDLNNFGHNALLKTLEEHQTYTSFFLIDHMNNDIPITLRSRCRTIIFQKLHYKDIINYLNSSSIEKSCHRPYAILSNGSIGEIDNLHKHKALEIHDAYCNYIIGIINQSNEIKQIKKLFINKKNNSKIYSISFLILFRFFKNTLKKINSLEITYINTIEEKLVDVLTKYLKYDEIVFLLNCLYSQKENMLKYNLETFTSIYLILNNLEKLIKKNAK